MDYAEDESEVAIQPAVSARPVPRAVGRRHENAPHNARMLSTPEDPLISKALTTAQQHFDSKYVLAAHDLMVVSVERLPYEDANEDFVSSRQPEAGSSSEMPAGSAAPMPVSDDVAEASAERAAARKAQQRREAEDFEWDPVEQAPQPQEATL